MSEGNNGWKVVSLRQQPLNKNLPTLSVKPKQPSSPWTNQRTDLVGMLPLELWALVAQYLDDVDDILALGLTCKSLSVLLQLGDTWKRASVRIYCPVFTRVEVGTFAFVKMVEDLRAHGVYYIKPTVASKLNQYNIRCLTLCGPNIRLDPPFLEVFAKQVANLQALTLLNCTMFEERFVALAKIDSLKKLVLHACSSIQGLHACNGIKHLELRNCFVETAPMRHELRSMPALRSICIAGGRGLTPRLRDDLLRLRQNQPQLPALEVVQQPYVEKRYHAFELPLQDPNEFPFLG
eukprot:m.39829 g.39829  ORF g.39829 m.39829 type:complete len:293 (-) comp12702_c0_seq4:122-1000(-)